MASLTLSNRKFRNKLQRSLTQEIVQVSSLNKNHTWSGGNHPALVFQDLEIANVWYKIAHKKYTGLEELLLHAKAYPEWITTFYCHNYSPILPGKQKTYTNNNVGCFSPKRTISHDVGWFSPEVQIASRTLHTPIKKSAKQLQLLKHGERPCSC